MKKKDDSGCTGVLIFAGLAVAIYLVYSIVKFFQRPDAIATVLRGLEAAGMCLGIAVVALGGLILVARIGGRRRYPKLTQVSGDYPVCCFPVEVKTPGSGDQPEAPAQETVLPVYLLVSTTNYGLCLAALPVQDPPGWVPADSAERFKGLSGERPGPVILPMGLFQLRYDLRRQGNAQTGLPPADKAGLAGALPLPSPGTQVVVVIDYTAILEPVHLAHTISLEQPLRLRLVAVDAEGHDDLESTRGLYDAIYQQMYLTNSSDDDSWMYRSRPMVWPYC